MRGRMSHVAGRQLHAENSEQSAEQHCPLAREAFTPRIQKVIYTRFHLIWCKNSRNSGFCQVLDLGPPNARNLTIKALPSFANRCGGTVGFGPRDRV
jgi:hypothetical protein